MGTLASVLQLLKLPDGTVKVLVEGTERVEISSYVENEDYFEAVTEPVSEELGSTDEIEALARSSVGQFESYVRPRVAHSPRAFPPSTETKGRYSFAERQETSAYSNRDVA